MKRLKEIQEALICEAYEQIECLEKVDAKELGEVIDMIKDIDETCYYQAKYEKIEKELEMMSAGEMAHTYKMPKMQEHEGAVKMSDLRYFIEELSEELVGIVSAATAEEKKYLEHELAELSAKISTKP